MSETAPAGGGILPGLIRVAAALAAVTAARAGRRLALTVIGYLCVVGLFIVSLCFMTSAGHLALVGAVGEVPASLIVGAVYLVAALAGALWLQTLRR